MAWDDTKNLGASFSRRRWELQLEKGKEKQREEDRERGRERGREREKKRARDIG